MNRYVEDLERRIEQLEMALEANKRNFHVLTPDEKYIVTEPFTMVDRFLCSFSRDLNMILYKAGKTSPIWSEVVELAYHKHSTGLLSKQKFEFINYTIPKGTIFKIKCYEVKKRKTVNPEYDFVRTIVEHYPDVPEATGKILNFKRAHFSSVIAESYNDYLIENGIQ